MDSIKQYLQSIKDINENVGEQRHRTALQNLLESIKDELATTHKDFSHISIIHEPNNDKSENKAGAPDFQINCGFSRAGGGNLTLGYIENKRVNADFLRLIDESNKNPREQLAKYLTLSPNLILTDYLRFLRLEKTQDDKIKIIQEVKICALDEITILLKDKSKLESKQQELLEFFTLFFSSTPKPINTAQEFANAIALPTKYIKEEILALKDEERITHLYENFHKGLYEKLEFKDFCDNFAQTLVYALFLAKFHKDLNDKELNNVSIELSNITDFIPHSVALLGGFANSLKELNHFKNLKWILDHTLCIINHISVANLLQEFNKHNKKQTNSIHHNPTLHFYEHFIGKYNGELKKDKGVYYTHESIVSFIINAVILS